MAPLANGMADFGASFKDKRRQAATKEMGRGRKPDRACADYSHG
jgi:hypothetical protein